MTITLDKIKGMNLKVGTLIEIRTKFGNVSNEYSGYFKGANKTKMLLTSYEDTHGDSKKSIPRTEFEVTLDEITGIDLMREPIIKRLYQE
jgi:hypothetical protein